MAFRPLLIGFSLVFLGVLSFISWYIFSQRGSFGEAAVQHVIVGNIGEYSILNILAQEKGFFAEHGLNVDLREYQSGPPAIVDLLDGKLDISIAADFVGVRNIFTNNQLRILTEVSKQHVFQIVALKDRGIYTPEDLRGKRIGVTKKGAGEFFLGRFLTFNHLALSEVTIVDLSANEMIQHINNAQIDAIVIFEPHVFNLMKSFGDRVIVWSVQGEEDTFALAYSTQAYIERHPDIVEKYLRSLAQAEQYVREHQESAQSLLAQHLSYDDAYMDYVWPKFFFGLSLRQTMILTLEDQARWAISNHITDATRVPDYLQYIYFDALSRVRPEAVTIFHD